MGNVGKFTKCWKSWEMYGKFYGKHMGKRWDKTKIKDTLDTIEETHRHQERDGKLPLETPDLCISSCLLVPGRRKAGLGQKNPWYFTKGQGRPLIKSKNISEDGMQDLICGYFIG